MKLRLHWAEKWEVVREYPAFDLDSHQFPELEKEMVDVFNAGSAQQQHAALADLEYKMHQTPASDRGETIFEMMGPHDSFSEAHTYPVTDQLGFLTMVTEQ
jgi:hypothetical protein